MLQEQVVSFSEKDTNVSFYLFFLWMPRCCCCVAAFMITAPIITCLSNCHRRHKSFSSLFATTEDVNEPPFIWFAAEHGLMLRLLTHVMHMWKPRECFAVAELEAVEDKIFLEVRARIHPTATWTEPTMWLIFSAFDDIISVNSQKTLI